MSNPQPQCAVCGDSGWAPNIDANGNRVWLPLMNDALPCKCGALARNYAAERAFFAAASAQPVKDLSASASPATKEQQ